MPACCRSFDYVSLFHVGEFRTPENDAYGALTDLEMTLMLADKIKPGGEMLFYTGSFAYDKAEAVAKELVKQRALRAGADYKSLQDLQEAGGLTERMSIWDIYKRALAMLVVERGQTIWVVLSGIALGIVPIAEQVLLARVVDALARGQGAFPIIGLWAVLGLFGIVAGVVVAVMADRLAHRRRLAALGQAFEHAIILPISYHAEKGSGAVVRTILAGTDALFWNWLSFLREQFVALVGIARAGADRHLHERQDGADPGGAGRRLCARQRVRGAQDQHRPGRRRAVPQQRLRPRRRRARQRHGGAELRALRLRDAGHAHHHGRAAGRAISGADLVGPADRAHPHGRHHHRGRHLRRGRRAGAARADHGRRDRGLRGLRRPADRQARPAVGLCRAHLPVRADAAQLLRPARCHRRRAREAGRQAARPTSPATCATRT